MNINASQPVTSAPAASTQHAQSRNCQVKDKVHLTWEKVAKYAASSAVGALVLGGLSAATCGMAIPISFVLGGYLVAGGESLYKAATLFKEAVQGKKSIAECWKQLSRHDKITVIAVLSFSALAITLTAGFAVLLFTTGPSVALPYLALAGMAIGAILGPMTYHYWSNLAQQQQQLPRS